MAVRTVLKIVFATCILPRTLVLSAEKNAINLTPAGDDDDNINSAIMAPSAEPESSASGSQFGLVTSSLTTRLYSPQISAKFSPSVENKNDTKLSVTASTPTRNPGQNEGTVASDVVTVVHRGTDPVELEVQAKLSSSGGSAAVVVSPTPSPDPTYLVTPIIDVKSIRVTPETITLCLIQPVGPEGSIMYTIRAVSYDYSMESWLTGHFLNGTTICITQPNLVSGMTYKVDVISRDDDLGRSVSKAYNITTVLHPIKFGIPELIQVNGGTMSANITWSFVNQTYVESFIFAYNQSDSYLASPKYAGGFQQYGSAHIDGSQRSITLHEVLPGAHYTLWLLGMSGLERTSLEWDWLPATEPPSHVRPITTTQTTVELAWTFPPHTPPSLVRHFVIEYTMTGQRSTRPIMRSTHTTGYLISGLVPGAQYRVKVWTVSSNGQPSEARFLTLDIEVAQPTHISEKFVDSTSFSLAWMAPAGYFDSVSVSYPCCPAAHQLVVNGVNTVTFTRLLSGVVYNVTLVAVRGQARSEPITYSMQTYPAGPTRIQVIYDKEAHLSVFWATNLCSGCLFDYYIASLNGITPGSQSVSQQIVYCLPGRKCSTVFRELMPGRAYRVEVQAVRSGLASFPPAIALTKIPPATPGPITFLKVTHDQIHIVWYSQGDVTKYIVSLCEVRVRPPSFTRLLPKSPMMTGACSLSDVYAPRMDHSWGGLQPMTNYNITLAAVSGSIRSDTVWTVKTTTPMYPKVNSILPESPNKEHITPYSFPVTFHAGYFDNSNSDILSYVVLVAKSDERTNTELQSQGNLTVGRQTLTWAMAVSQDFLYRYQIADPYSYTDLLPDSDTTITVGSEQCSKAKKNVYCNGPLDDNREYVYQFRVFTKDGFVDTPFSQPVFLPEDNTGIVAGICVTLILLFIIVLVLIGVILSRKYRSNYGKYIAARSMEPLSVGVMNRSLTKQRHSRPVLIANFSHDFQVMNAHCHYGFSQEYKSISKVGRKMTSYEAVLVANVSKNRYTNILPFDRTRVMLSPIDDVEGSDYINANYIPGYSSPREYIACQGPLPGTVDDMWRSVWEQNSATIVMLTQLVEKATVKCDQYWPDVNTSLIYGDIKVTSNSKEEFDGWHVYNIIMEMNERTKHIKQYHYLAWPDHGVPDSSSTLIAFIRTVRDQIPTDGTPTIVHCSAGVGRTGTFICLDRLMKHIEEYEFVDILSIVCDLRAHRNYMVQTEQQYVFIHKCILDILQEKGIVPKRLPSISSLDTNDIHSRLGSGASALPRADGRSGIEDNIILRSSTYSEDEDDARLKRVSMYSMGSPKKFLIEEDSRASSPKNGSVKKLANPFRANIREESTV